MIVAHSNDYETFQNIISDTLKALHLDSIKRHDYYLSRGGTDLEKDVFKFILTFSSDTIFNNNIELISGQKFPDIVAYVNESKAYGIEVKTTKQDKWKSTGSSIFEGTRVANVENIFLLFGKLTEPIEFKCKKYEECLYDVAITHSPRYLIDMDINLNETIFSKVGVNYETLRKLDNPFKPIKKYFRQFLKEGEDLWWVENSDETVREPNIKLWGNITPVEKNELRVTALAYFPSLFSSNGKKYSQLATWLVSKFGLVNHALRDTFTAGGQTEIDKVSFPKIFEHLINDLNLIFKRIETIDEDDILYYWEIEKIDEDPVKLWKKQCLMHCKKNLTEEQFKIVKRILK
jgi:hypothetical protein